MVWWSGSGDTEYLTVIFSNNMLYFFHRFYRVCHVSQDPSWNRYQKCKRLIAGGEVRACLWRMRCRGSRHRRDKLPVHSAGPTPLKGEEEGGVLNRKVPGLQWSFEQRLLKPYFVRQKWPSSSTSTALSNQLGAASGGPGEKAMVDPEWKAGSG